MRRFLLIALAVIVAVLVAAPYLIPVDSLKSRVISQLESSTGRKVEIKTLHLSLFPALALKAEGVKIGNPAWAGAGQMADIKSLHLGVALAPLLHGAVDVEDFTVEEPVMMLVKKGAQANWQFEATAEPKAAQKNSTAGASHTAITLRNIALKNGTITYRDMDSGSTKSLTNLGFALNLPAPGKAEETELKLTLGSTNITWKGTLALKDVPSLTGAVHIDVIDAAAESNTKKSPTAGSAGAPAGGEHFSSDPIDFALLKSANLDVSLLIDKLKLKNTSLSDIKAHVKLQGGALSIKIEPIAAYGGTVVANVTAGSGGSAALSAAVEGVKAEPLLDDAIGWAALHGTLSGKVALNASGNSQRALVSNLAGSGDIAVKNGDIAGANIAAMAQNIASAFQKKDGQSTSFDALKGSFTAARGVLTNNDLTIESSLLHVTGSGTADLPGWKTDYLLKPKLGADLAGIIVPIRIEGALDNPRYMPDLKSAITSNIGEPKAVQKTLQTLQKNLLDKALR